MRVILDLKLVNKFSEGQINMRTQLRLLFVVLTCLIATLTSYAQIIRNGTFNDNQGINIINWSGCVPNTTLDIQPGTWGISLPPFDGDSYMGMVCRGTTGTNANTCEDARQQLNQPLLAGRCYTLSIQLAYGDNFTIEDYRNPIDLEIFLGTESCSKEIKLAEFGPISNAGWAEYTVNFTVPSDMTHILLQADYSSESSIYFGNLLLDQLSITELGVSQLDVGNDTILCPGEIFELEVNLPGFDIIWSDGTVGPKITISNPGAIWLQAQNGCDVFVDTIIVKYITDVSQINLGEDTTLCFGDTLAINFDSEETNYTWNGLFNSSEIDIYTAGKYWVEASNICTQSSDTILVNFIQPPQINFGADTIICNDEIFTIDISNQTDQVTWFDNDTSLQRTFDVSGIYWATVEGECTSITDTVIVTFANCNCRVFVPNTFTPNSDNINDSFLPRSSCEIIHYHLQIFNRWGVKVFETEELNESWDGKFDGQNLDTGVYSYALEYAFFDSPLVTKIGSVTVIR